MFYTGWSASGEAADWALSPLFVSQNFGRRRSLIPLYSNKQVDSDLAAAFKDQRSAGENTIVQRGAGYYLERVPIPRWWWSRPGFCANSKNLTGFWIMPDTGFSFDDAGFEVSNDADGARALSANPAKGS